MAESIQLNGAMEFERREERANQNNVVEGMVKTKKKRGFV